ncbi:MAG: hypothetical protein WC748_09320 [Legionellales bacterium]
MHKKSSFFFINLFLFIFSNYSFANCDEGDDVTFVALPDIRHIACEGPARNATYTLQNCEPAALTVTQVKMSSYDNYAYDLITVDNGPLTTCQGVISAYGQCNINLIIKPSACTTGPINGNINRLLSMRIGSQQGELTTPVQTVYTTLGAGDYFALVGSDLTNDDGYGAAAISGDTGFTDMGYTGSFLVSNGTQYLSPTAPEVMAANGDFLATFQMFTRIYFPACDRRGSLKDGDVLTPGYRCLFNTNDNSGIVDVSGKITFKGTGRYLFFVDPLNTPTCGTTSPRIQCHLNINPDAHFEFLDGASLKDVYWIVGHNGSAPALTLYSGAYFAGNVLSIGRIISINDNNRGSTVGHLWSYSPIGLVGNSISIPQ